MSPAGCRRPIRLAALAVLFAVLWYAIAVAVNVRWPVER